MTLLEFLLIQLNFAILFGVYQLFHSKNGHTIANRIYLLLVPIVSCIIPFLEFGFLPETASVSTPLTLTLQEIEVVPNAESSIPTNTIIYFIIGGVSIALALFQIARFLNRPKAKFVGSYDGFKLYEMNGETTTFSFFNRIYFNKQEEKNREIILIHESAHCRQKHSLDILFYTVVKSLFWFNPFVYLLAKKVKENHEFLADEYVVKRTQNAKEYGQVLLSVALNLPVKGMVHSFRGESDLSKRINRLVINNKYNMKQLVVVPVLAMLAMVSVSMQNVEEKTPVLENVVPVEEVIENPDVYAEFVGGNEAFMKYISENLKFPESLKDKDIKSRGYYEFVVEKNGSIGKATIKRGAGYDLLDAEALRVLKSMPNWKPGEKDGKKVATKVTLPIAFQTTAK